jgi:hypothetical protein
MFLNQTQHIVKHKIKYSRVNAKAEHDKPQ